MKIRFPDRISVFTEKGERRLSVYECSVEDIELSFDIADSKLNVSVIADTTPLKYIKLKWLFTKDEYPLSPVKILGDEWERGYGAMEWRGIVPERCMPWYMLASEGSDSDSDTDGRITYAYGVSVRPAALCFWQYDAQGVTLWLDIRNGGSGVILGGRKLKVAEVIFREYRDMSAFEAGERFCGEMCRDPLTLPHPVYGSNNWYYAYGNSSHDEIIADTKIVTELCAGLENIPYMVIDDGWQKYNMDGPWFAGNQKKFPDMKGLADKIKELGARPGIWIRYLADTHRDTPNVPDEWRLSRDNGYLDPSHPGVISKIIEDTSRIVDWGYQLIKHDFSTYDIFGGWGFERPRELTNDSWSFYDRSRTSAEIVVDMYRTIHETAKDTIIIGCNCIGHLCAGLHHLNRTGDDTSGFEWSRTRKMGVNTLAFRMMQNGKFFAADADCVGITGAIDWSLNSKWLYALANSGSPLFVSCKPNVLNKSELEQLKNAFKIASVQKDRLVPVDWMENICPSKWTLNGNEISFDWFE